MAIYKYKPTHTISQIWESLGTFWAEFEDKEIIEAFWSGLWVATQLLQRNLYYVVLSRTMSTLPAVIEAEHDYYTIYFSGINQNTVSQGSGIYFFEMPRYTYYI